MGLAVGACLALLAGAIRILFGSFLVRGSFLVATVVALSAFLFWFPSAVKCLHIADNVGEVSNYWNKTSFVIFLFIPGILTAFCGGALAWGSISFIVEALPNLRKAYYSIGFFSIYGLALFSICFSYAYFVTQWSLEVCALTLIIPPVWGSMSIWGPIYVCYKIGDWMPFISLFIALLICLAFTMPYSASDKSDSSV